MKFLLDLKTNPEFPGTDVSIMLHLVTRRRRLEQLGLLRAAGRADTQRPQQRQRSLRGVDTQAQDQSVAAARRRSRHAHQRGGRAQVVRRWRLALRLRPPLRTSSAAAVRSRRADREDGHRGLNFLQTRGWKGRVARFRNSVVYFRRLFFFWTSSEYDHLIIHTTPQIRSAQLFLPLSVFTKRMVRVTLRQETV